MSLGRLIPTMPWFGAKIHRSNLCRCAKIQTFRVDQHNQVAAMDEQAERRLELKRQFSDFLDQGSGDYPDKIKALLNKQNLQLNKLRLDVDVHDVQRFDAALHSSLLQSPAECIQPFEEALDELVRNAYPKRLGEEQAVRVSFSGEFGAHRVTPRELTSDFISRLVNLEGIVTKCSLVRPKILKSVHYAEATGRFTNQEYRDVTSNTGAPTGSTYPTRDEEGNLLSIEYGLCVYCDHQVVTLQVSAGIARAAGAVRDILPGKANKVRL